MPAAAVIAEATSPLRLELRGVTLRARVGGQPVLAGVELGLPVGRLVVVVLPFLASRSLAEAALGFPGPEDSLRQSSEGEIRLDGQAWGDRSLEEQLQARGRIRRIFGRGGWISNLDVLENVLLSRLHHGGDSIGRLRREADGWGTRFGLQAVPQRRPTSCTRSQLQRCQWVRAMMGQPQLLVLEQPFDGIEREYWPNLLGGLKECLGAGAAALWLTSDAAELERVEALAWQSWRVVDQRLERVQGGAA
jgi:phospholipid/cholesterol/gamma-HCH transport system ATP-binding protein